MLTLLFIKKVRSWTFVCCKVFNHGLNFSACDWSVHIFYFFLIQSRETLIFLRVCSKNRLIFFLNRSLAIHIIRLEHIQ